jgi:predicted RNA polymerase sigma factor
MSVDKELLERLCKCLAFHAVETELTFQFMTPQEPAIADRIAEAKQLVAEAGFDFDVLYPVKDRPTALLAEHVDGMLGAGC